MTSWEACPWPCLANRDKARELSNESWLESLCAGWLRVEGPRHDHTPRQICYNSPASSRDATPAMIPRQSIQHHLRAHGGHRTLAGAGLLRSCPAVARRSPQTTLAGLTLTRGARIYRIWGRGESVEQEETGHIAVGQDEALLFFDSRHTLSISVGQALTPARHLPPQHRQPPAPAMADGP
jgi:hypothetical protein